MRFQDPLCKLGDVWHISDNLVSDQEEFTCAMCVSLLYFEAEVSNIDFSQFPPCRKTLSQHIIRVNYQTGISKLAHISQPFIHLAINGHGWTEKNGQLVSVWCQGPIIPI